MKKLFAVTLLIALLCQALPVEALAVVGRVLTQEEIDRARALTGLSFGQDQGNGRSYHSGMKPNVGWNAKQLRDWLDERLVQDLDSASDVLSQVFYTLSDIQQSDPAKYRMFTENSQYESARSMQLQTESLREEMRYYRDQLREASGIIAEMSRWLEEERSAIFDSDAVRYSARILEAQREIRQLRASILEKTDVWESDIASLKHYLKYGPSEEDRKLGVGQWMETLLKDEEPVVKTAALTRTGPSNSLRNRLQMASGLLDDADAQITVYSDNDVILSLKTEKDGKQVPVDGATIMVRDALNPEDEWESYDYRNGTVVIPINKLTADEYDLFHIAAKIDPTAQGYREVTYEDLDLERGVFYTCLLTPLGGPDNDAGASDPYIYMMSFNKKDIMQSEYEMIYSSANDYEFDIRVGVRNPSGEALTGIKMVYWEHDGAHNPKRCEVGPTDQDGDVYIFRGPWKKRFSPYAKVDQRPAFILGDGDSAQTFPSQLVSVRSATDEPINEGTGPDRGVFANVLGKFRTTFTIPFVEMNVTLNLPLTEFIPKLSINPGGYIVIYVGASAFEDEVKSKQTTLWESKDAKDFRNAQKFVEKEGAFANYAAQYDLAKEFYKEKQFKCLGNFSIDLGWFALATGRWELDNSNDDVLSTLVSLRAGTGFTVTLNANWTIVPIPAFPILYVGVSVGLSAGFSAEFTLDLCWVNGEFQDWSLRPIDNITIDIGLLFALQVGVGIKGFLEGFVKGTVSLDVFINLSLYSPASIRITGALGVTVGVTVFFITISKSWNTSKQFYPSEAAGNLLRHYMNAGDDEPRKVEPGYDDPQSYPALAVTAEERCSTQSASGEGYPSRIIRVNGNMFAFSIYEVTGADGRQHSRVGYRGIDPQSGSFSSVSSVQVFVDQDTSSYHDPVNERDDYDFDVYVLEERVFIVATSAREFDEDGYPVRNDMSSASYENRYLNMIAWMIILNCSSDGQFSYEAYTLKCQSFQWNEDASKAEYSYDSLGTPHISFARKFRDSHGSPAVEMYGEIGRVAYPDDPDPAGSTGFGYYYDEYSPDGPESDFLLYPDKMVRSAMGDDYEFILTCSLMDMDASERMYSWGSCYHSMYSMSFVGLSRPKDGAAGDSAIELFGFDMNSVERRAIVLDQGAIGKLVTMKDQEVPEGETAGMTVFYTLGETNGDGATRYRLCGLRLGPVKGQATSNLEYDVTRYEYDVVMPTSDFDICYFGTVPYLYWVTTAPKKQDSEPDVWRVWIMLYDSLTNSLSSPAVFAEFALPMIHYTALHSGEQRIYADEQPAMRNVILTGTGTGYLNAVFSDMESIPEEERPKRVPISLLSFPELLTPSTKLISATPRELVVRAGSFDDMQLGVVNDGNLAIASLDLAMYEVTDSGDENLVQTAHIDALDPAKNAVTMADGTVVHSGKAAGYREEDYDNTSRRRDWVLDREALAYRIHLADGKATVDTQTVEPSDPQHISTDILMPGSTAGYTIGYWIPDNWEGSVKTLRMKVTSASTFANWMRVSALAAGARANGTLANANANGELVELKYVLNEKTGKLELQKPANLTGPLTDAIQSGLIAREAEIDSVPVTVEIHDLEVGHRVYRGAGGERWLDITVRNHAATREGMKLVCAVYVDGAKEPSYVNLPYYENAALGHKTQTISLPVSALVDDPNAHSRARVEILSVDRDERAYANNEFTVYLGGNSALRFVKQPEDVTAQEGEDVSFSVEVAGGTQPYSYRWQVWDPGHEKWVDLPGYTDAAISRENIEKKWDDAKLRCVVTDAVGAKIVSQEVTLTVRDKVSTGDGSNLPLYLAVAMITLTLLLVLRRRRWRVE